MTQGARVKMIRKRLGLTMDKFGERIGIKKVQSVKLKMIKVLLLNKISKLYAVSLKLTISGLPPAKGKCSSNPMMMSWQLSIA